eukprot:560359-Amphidinium_carterae.1
MIKDAIDLPFCARISDVHIGSPERNGRTDPGESCSNKKRKIGQTATRGVHARTLLTNNVRNLREENLQTIRFQEEYFDTVRFIFLLRAGFSEAV